MSETGRKGSDGEKAQLETGAANGVVVRSVLGMGGCVYPDKGLYIRAGILPNHIGV